MCNRCVTDITSIRGILYKWMLYGVKVKCYTEQRSNVIRLKYKNLAVRVDIGCGFGCLVMSLRLSVRPSVRLSVSVGQVTWALLIFDLLTY